MRGLYISFVIKRRKKVDKVMDFFLVAAIFIFIFTFLFYVQYVQKANKYNSTKKTVQTNNAEALALKEQVDKMDKENTSQLEKVITLHMVNLKLKQKKSQSILGILMTFMIKDFQGLQ